MKKQITILCLLFLSISAFGQNQNERVLYIVDSIPVIEEPKEGFGTLTENEIDITNKVETAFSNLWDAYQLVGQKEEGYENENNAH